MREAVKPAGAASVVTFTIAELADSPTALTVRTRSAYCWPLVKPEIVKLEDADPVETQVPLPSSSYLTRLTAALFAAPGVIVT